MRTAPLPRAFKAAATLLCAGVLFTLGGKAAWAETTVNNLVEEAVAVHGMATAARICGFMTEGDLNRVRARMDDVHTHKLNREDRESYLIMRTSDSFRNYVYAQALNKAQAGCNAELRAAWSEVHASLIFADIMAQDAVADASAAATRSN